MSTTAKMSAGTFCWEGHHVLILFSHSSENARERDRYKESEGKRGVSSLDLLLPKTEYILLLPS